MSRKTFIESVGATCKNWQWSWSFINSNEGFIVFGAWDRNTEGTKTLIFSEEWQSSAPDGRKPPGYSQSREHIRLIENENYKLMTFPMKYSDARTGVTAFRRLRVRVLRYSPALAATLCAC